MTLVQCTMLDWAASHDIGLTAEFYQPAMLQPTSVSGKMVGNSNLKAPATSLEPSELECYSGMVLWAWELQTECMPGRREELTQGFFPEP